MALQVVKKINLFHQRCTLALLDHTVNNANMQIVRHRRTKHWNPKWKLFRRLKVQKVELPDFRTRTEDLSKEEIRLKMKEQGLLPPRPWVERQYFIHSTGDVFEPYVPPEGDGKVSAISKQGAINSARFLEKKSRTMLAMRKIGQFEEDFDVKAFCANATKIYIEMHELMAAKDKDKLIDVVTERAYPEVLHNIDNKTIHWKYIKDIELPRVVQARCTDIISKENIFAQVTVRFHTQQILAIYDRFGRLMQGSEIIAKDVLEYIVFENHLANEYGRWRVHAKIIPEWLPPRVPRTITYKQNTKSIPESNTEIAESDSKDQVLTKKATSDPV